MILALESSCDETAVAVFDPERGLTGEWIHSQIALHERHGGVVPDLATREHLRHFGPLLARARAASDFSKLSRIAVTRGPGLAACLAIGVAAKLYAAEPDFYRAMARTVVGTESLGQSINAPRTAFWREGVAAAVREGALLPGADGPLGEALTHLFRGVFLHWAAGEIDVARLEAEIVYGFALMLLAYAAPAQTDGLRACIQTLEPVLRSPA